MDGLLTVAELNGYLKAVLDSDPVLAEVWVAGEVSNCKRHTSGHWYLTLKEGDERIDAVCFRQNAARLTLQPRDGMAVLAYGRVGIFNGRVQVYIDALRPSGEGLAQAEFERLRAQLQHEGLFERFRALPPFPQRIGIVTSPTSAALQDMLNILRRRYPLAEVLLSPALVQGEDAPDSLVEALYALYDQPLDVIILARGGGSSEDLAAFNAEQVARAVYASPVPLVTGVGHETDTTLVDFVADQRAPTPSAAAELISPDAGVLRDGLQQLQMLLTDALLGQIDAARTETAALQSRLERVAPLARLRVDRQALDRLLERGERLLRQRLSVEQTRLRALQRSLAALNPVATLERGYALVVDELGQPVTSPTQLRQGDLLEVRVRGGKFLAEVRE